MRSYLRHPVGVAAVEKEPKKEHRKKNRTQHIGKHPSVRFFKVGTKKELRCLCTLLVRTRDNLRGHRANLVLLRGTCCTSERLLFRQHDRNLSNSFSTQTFRQPAGGKGRDVITILSINGGDATVAFVQSRGFPGNAGGNRQLASFVVRPKNGEAVQRPPQQRRRSGSGNIVSRKQRRPMRVTWISVICGRFCTPKSQNKSQK